MRPDWREHVAKMILGQEPLEGDLLQGSDRLTPLQQLEIYRDQYLLRVPGALAEDRPGLRQLLGEDWEELARSYLRDCPPKSWSLEHLAWGLEDWLVQRGAPTQQLEMCRLDEAVQQSFFAASGRTPRPQELQSLPALKLQPHVRLLRLCWSVSAVRSAGEGEPRAGDFRVLVFRPQRQVRTAVLEPACWNILKGLEQGLELDQALASALAEEPPEGLAERVQDWFRFFVERSLVELA